MLKLALVHINTSMKQSSCSKADKIQLNLSQIGVTTAKPL